MQILVLYYSRTGNTQKLAEAIAKGVDEIDGVTAVLKKTDEVTKDDFLNSDGVIAGSPVYFGVMAAQLKKFTEKPAPESLAGANDFSMPLDGMGKGGVAEMLLADDPYAAITDGADKISYNGSVVLQGSRCHKIIISKEDRDFEGRALLLIKMFSGEPDKAMAIDLRLKAMSKIN